MPPKKALATRTSGPGATKEKSSTKDKSNSQQSISNGAANDTTKLRLSAKSEESDKENEHRKAAASTKTNNMKMKRERSDEDEQPVKRTARVNENKDESSRPTKQLKKTHEAKRSANVKTSAQINEAPSNPLDIFVFGEGGFGELGLGSEMIDGKKPRGITRPRLNSKLSAQTVGVVQVACGGMHAVALTKSNRILTWGVNDLGALGRDTTWEGRDANDEEEEDDDDVGFDLNPFESTPTPIDVSKMDYGVTWVQVAASDSASFALTQDGHVYGWGTFRSNDGVLGFNEYIDIQRTPSLIPGLKDIKQIAAGSNHVLALDAHGRIQAWGAGQQYQLGRRVFEDHPKLSLRPAPVRSLPVHGARAVKVACGSWHSFAIDQDGRVYAWGLNNFGGLGIPDGAGEDSAFVAKPQLVKDLEEYEIADIAGGMHHSIACTEDGKLLAWGRIDFHQVGLPTEAYTKENTIFDERNNPRILKIPTAIPNIPPIVAVGAGTSHSLAITRDGKAYSWGFSQNFQTGQRQEEDVEIPTLIDNTAVKDRKLTFADAGAQFSLVAGLAEI